MCPGQTSAKSPRLQQALQRAVEPARALLRVDGEVGPGDVAHEERVSGDDEPGLIAPAPVGDQVGGVLGPVPGRRERRDRDLADATTRSPSASGSVVEVDAGRRRYVDRRAGRLREPALARDMVGVVVRLEDVA